MRINIILLQVLLIIVVILLVVPIATIYLALTLSGTV